MARIDFAFGATEKIAQACQTTLKQYLAGHKLLVYCSDATRLKAFDTKLWAVEPTAFVPHVMATDPLAEQTPIWLVSSDLEQALARAPADAWLLNLDKHCPPALGNTARVLEIVSEDEEDKTAARARWAQYKAAGHELKAHQLTSNS
jgi:DNA polymerase-3 subunit chi